MHATINFFSGKWLIIYIDSGITISILLSTVIKKLLMHQYHNMSEVPFANSHISI